VISTISLHSSRFMPYCLLILFSIPTSLPNFGQHASESQKEGAMGHNFYPSTSKGGREDIHYTAYRIMVLMVVFPWGVMESGRPFYCVISNILVAGFLERWLNNQHQERQREGPTSYFSSQLMW